MSLSYIIFGRVFQKLFEKPVHNAIPPRSLVYSKWNKYECLKAFVSHTNNHAHFQSQWLSIKQAWDFESICLIPTHKCTHVRVHVRTLSFFSLRKAISVFHIKKAKEILKWNSTSEMMENIFYITLNFREKKIHISISGNTKWFCSCLC